MHLLFDLDGTLSDPFPGITRCLAHALGRMGRPAPPAEELRWCIGPPLKHSLARLLATDDAAPIETALALYRERFAAVGLFENTLYKNIPDVLGALQQKGHALYVATSKPVVFARRIVDHFGLQPYFRGVYGSELDGTRADKAHLIAHILRNAAIRSGDAVMIGDRAYDMIGARENGLACIGVLWGYGSQDELAAAGARAVVASPRELVPLLERRFAS